MFDFRQFSAEPTIIAMQLDVSRLTPGEDKNFHAPVKGETDHGRARCSGEQVFVPEGAIVLTSIDDEQERLLFTLESAGNGYH